jgi:hypothetical protein
MKKITCPCCGYITLDSDGNYDICGVCFWEDDPFQRIEVYSRGSNRISIIEAQKNYLRYGACEKKFIGNVRKPNSYDKRDPDWKPINDYLFELKLACRKFMEGQYTIADLTHNLSWIEVPSEFKEIVKDTENGLEMIRFCTSDGNQRFEALELINEMLIYLNIVIENND